MAATGRPAFPPTSIFGTITTLPRGPHRLTRAEVGTSQRTRVLAALVDLVAAKGYADTTITAIARQAGVSPNVFYEHFADREACFVAAYDAFTARLYERLEAVVLTADWEEFIRGTLDAYFGLLEDEPAAARAFLIEFDGAGETAREHRRQFYVTASVMLYQRHQALRHQHPSFGPLPERAFLGFVHAVRELACDRLEHEPSRPLTELTPDMARWIQAAVLGAAEVSGLLTGKEE